MKGGKYTKFLAKIQVRRMFRRRDFGRNVLPKFIEICMETPCVAHLDGHQTWQTETNKNICYRVWVQRDLYGDAMLVPTWTGSNLADGNQQKHLLPSLDTKA